MADKTGIEWTDATWNPTTGCDQVSPGCDNCYALTMAKRLKAMGSPAYQQDGDARTSGPGFALQIHEDRLDQPLRWTKPRRIFVNSMSDLFHPKVSDEFIARVFAVMALADRHTFQVLTKRPKRMRSLLNSERFEDMFAEALYTTEHPCGEESAEPAGSAPGPLPNVWLGTSVEDQQRADERIPELIDTPAAVRFLSMEPLLGPVDLTEWIDADWRCSGCRAFFPGSLLETCPACGRSNYWTGSLPKLHWVIVGGESGPGAHPMHPEWARDLRDQANASGVPFLFKQWGEWSPSQGRATDQILMWPDGSHRPDTGPPWTPAGWSNLERVGKHAGGRELDGRTWDEFPQAVTADA